MATEFIDNEEEREGVQQVTQGVTGGVSVGGGAPSGVSRPQQGSGRTVNLQKYIEANRPFRQQTGGLAGAISEKTEQRAEQVGQEVGAQRQAFEQQAQPLEQQLGQEGQQLIQTAFKDPQQILQQQQQLDRFQQLRQQQYQPQIQQLTPNFQQAQQQQQAIQQQAQQAGTEAGRFQLLRESFGRPTYSAGQQRLDQLLLQASPGQARQLQTTLGDLSQQTGQQLGQAQQELAARQAALQQMSGQRAEEIRNLFEQGADVGGVEEDLGQRGYRDIQADIERRVQEAQQQSPEQVEAFRQRIANRQLTAEDIAKLGLQEGQQIFDVDFSKYVQPTQMEATVSGVMSPEEYARYTALQQLTDADPFAAIDEAQLGTFQPYQASGEALQQAISGRQAQYQDFQQRSTTGFNTLQNQMAARMSGAGWSSLGEVTKGKDFNQLANEAASGAYGRLGRYAIEDAKKGIYKDPTTFYGFLQQAYKLQQEQPTYQAGNVLRSAPSDLETGGQFNVT